MCKRALPKRGNQSFVTLATLHIALEFGVVLYSLMAAVRISCDVTQLYRTANKPTAKAEEVCTQDPDHGLNNESTDQVRGDELPSHSRSTADPLHVDRTWQSSRYLPSVAKKAETWVVAGLA